MRVPAITLNKAALAFAVGSGVYFWYQFAALAALESQIGTQLATVGLEQVLTPAPPIVAAQKQAPIMAGLAGLAVLLLA